MTSKALAAWTELNDRQQGTLTVIYELEQGIEAERNRAAAKGNWDNRPAAQWRAQDFAHEPSDRRLVGTTDLQIRLAGHGWDNQGNGSTMAALAARGLITRSTRPTTFGFMHTVILTREGRAAARAGTTLTTGRAQKPALGERSWEVLVKLWVRGQEGLPLIWGRSTTIDNVLIGKHVPPLASRVHGGYEITDRGRDFYREHHAAHTAAYPDVHAPHPDGPDAEPWPAEADDILTRHQHHHRALCAAWLDTHHAHQAAEQELTTARPEPDATLPAEVRDLLDARHALWQDTARRRAHLAAEQAADLHQRGQRVARAYAAAALAVFRAAVTGTDPRHGLTTPDHDDPWDEPALPPPATTGIHAIDTEAAKLHAAAIGAPRRRRGPAPHHRTRRTRPTPPPIPGDHAAALADYLRDHTHGGALQRRLHPSASC